MDLYSRAARIIRNLPQQKGTAEQLKAMALKAGARPVEFEHAPKVSGSMTKDELAAHYEKAVPQVKERVYGTSKEEERIRAEIDQISAKLKANALRRELITDDVDYAQKLKEERKDLWNRREMLTGFLIENFPRTNMPKYAEYQTPGGSGYREITLHLPSFGSGDNITRGEFEDALRQSVLKSTHPSQHDSEYVQNVMDDPLPNVDPHSKVWRRAEQSLGIDGDYRLEFGYGDNDTMYYRTDIRHKNQHWPDKNVIAHIRMKDSEGPNGEKILHVEELQSDWAQDGRREGFFKPPVSRAEKIAYFEKLHEFEDAHEAAKRQYEDAIKDTQRVAEMAGLPREPRRRDFRVNDEYLNAISAWLEQRKAISQQHPDLMAADLREAAANSRYSQALAAMKGYQETEPKASSEGVLYHPYVANTGEWLDLALKRIGQEAAQGGYDKVIFTPGQAQADRYSLEKQVRSVHWSPETNKLKAMTLQGGEMFNETVPREKLPQYVGKEVADKLLATEPQFIQGANAVYHTLEGDNLRVGGEGMKTFYDSVVPKAANKLFGKVGAQVQPFGHTEEDGSQYHVMDVPRQMRREYAGAVPAFAKGGEVIPHGHPEREKNFRQWFGKSKLVDKEGNPLVLYHGTDKDFSAFDPEKHGGSDHGWYGVGHYLTADPEAASAYSAYRGSFNAMEGKEVHEGSNVLPVHVRLENPYIWPKDRRAAQSLDEAKKITEELIRMGYDGVIAPNYYDKGPHAPHSEVVAFHPEQIKSVFGNQGTFDPNDPDITKAQGGEVEDNEVGELNFSPVPSFVPYYKDPEYQNWFGKSKTHREGVPVTYYTGTSKDKDFDKFNVGRHGAWFTADPSEASEYAKRNDSQGYKRGYGWEMIPTNTASRVIPVHLKIENPYTGPLPESVLSGNYKKAQSDWFDTLRAKGHDGWIPEQYGGQLAVVLKGPHQIKSVNNRTWDPKNPRMDKAGGGEVEDDGITAYHATWEPFTQYDWSKLGSVTAENSTGGDWASNLAGIGPWAHERDLAKSVGAPVTLPVNITGEPLHFRSLDELERTVSEHGGPEEFRDRMLRQGFGHIVVNDEEFGGKSFVALAPEHFKVKTQNHRLDPKQKRMDKAGGGEVEDDPAPLINNPVSVFPKPQRMFGADEFVPGGKYLNAATKEDMTGHKSAAASIGVNPGGRPYFKASADAVDETGTPGRGSAITQTNLFKKKAGWRWLETPEGHEDTATLISIEHRNNHYYALNAHFPKGVDFERYPDKENEPRLRPTTRGNLTFGPQVGKISTRKGKEHPVYDHVIVKADGGAVGNIDDGITAYHGSPHDFDQFMMEKIGTGEGAQAYGHGLYFAEAEPVAKGYRDQLALKKNQMTLVDKTTGEPLAEDVPGYGPVQDFFNTYAYDLRDGDRKHRMSQWDSWKEGAARQLKDWENFRSHPDYADPETAKWAEEQMDGFRKQIADYDAAQKLLPKIIAKPLGHMYEVRINAHPDHFLDWDKPYSQQTPHVREALDRIGIQPPEPFFVWNGYSGAIGIKVNDGTATHYASFTDLGGRKGVQTKVGREDLGIYPSIETARAAAEARLKERNVVPEISGANIYGMVAGSRPDTLTGSSNPDAAKRLYEAGIRGIRYLDAGSRGAGEGSRNYVVFDDKLIDIKRKYADGGVVEEVSGSAEPPKQPAKRKGRASSVIVGERSPIVDRALMLVSRKA